MPELITAAEFNGRPSHDDLRNLIRRALTGGADIYGPGAPNVVDVSDTDCVVERSGQHWRYPYSVNEARDQVTLGVPVLVRLNWQDAPAAPIQAGDPDTRAFVTDLRGFTFGEGGPVRIEVCRDGTWQHPKWGEISVDPATRESFVANFAANVRKCGDLPLDYDHAPGPAPGWITGLANEGSSLFATVELTPSGRQRVASGEYRFFSPEWHPNWEDPATGKKHGPTLFGGGLTNRPFFRGMAAINCAEPPAARESGVSGATPRKETAMVEQEAGAAQFAERIQALELENATLRAAENRRQLTQTLVEMRFSEGREVLAPASRTALLEAVLPLPDAPRAAVVEALRQLQFAELGERGFGARDRDPEELTEEEVRELAAMTPTGKRSVKREAVGR